MMPPGAAPGVLSHRPDPTTPSTAVTAAAAVSTPPHSSTPVGVAEHPRTRRHHRPHPVGPVVTGQGAMCDQAGLPPQLADDCHQLYG
ncbi:hypothetical protein [Streptacidiphilus sp. BW17]|uniref:hypothetical protein n=1 Tax=Streptacidiphilus sp. BW17 TaxID=3156274 RepID=UPI003518C488